MRSPAQIFKITTLTMLMVVTTNTNHNIENESSQFRQVATVTPFIKDYDKVDCSKCHVTPKSVRPEKTLIAKVTCYNPDDPKQTSPESHGITAFDHKFKLGDNIIAMSHDLVKAGFTEDSVVKVEGFKQHFIVKDTMNKRHRKSADIAISDRGTTLKKRKEKALDFGKQYLRITKIGQLANNDKRFKETKTLWCHN